jgi:16S rRNA (cytosine1402-N4)-methyltransferase
MTMGGVCCVGATSMIDTSSFHEPVLLREILGFLKPVSGGRYFDGTLGGGGHAKAILDASNPDGEIWGFDLDADAILHCGDYLKKTYRERVHLIRENYADSSAYLKEIKLDGAILDLGVSSYQIDNPAKGFSSRKNSPLDMRFDTRTGISAATVLNTFSEEELTGIFSRFGEERYSKKIARSLVKARKERPFEESQRLTDVITGAISKGFGHKSVARIFQALRIFVNDELGSLERGLGSIFGLLDNGGRFVVISYHSLEDRLVKNHFQYLEADCVCPVDLPECRCDKVSQVEILTRKPVIPTSEELLVNPRARSAKLRAVRKVVKPL